MFRIVAAVLAAGALSVGAGSAQENTRYTGPIIDMHLHAYPADANGPAPTAICVSFAADLKYDPATPWPVALGGLTKNPPCETPIWGPGTDDDVREQTIAAMRKLNITGVLSGKPEQVAAWQREAPGLFVAGRELSLKRDDVSAAQLEQEFVDGRFEVLAEVTNQYRGILADDPAFDAYWAVAAKHDIPVGIHLGIGPPGSPMLYKDFRVQTPLQMESILNRHQGLRVYLMHAGFPFTDDLKAMLYLYPQLYVDTGVLQVGVTRDAYYAFLEEIVRAGFGDRIMYGTDQMNWPGLIEEGVNAINDAPFLTYEQKQDILHDNAARFLRRASD